MAETENRSYIDTFVDFDDAVLYLEKHLLEHAEGWEILEAGVGHVNHQWRVGAVFSRKNEQQIEIEGVLKQITGKEFDVV